MSARTSARLSTITVLAGLAAANVLAGCTSDDEGAGDEGSPVSITVGGLPPTTEAETREVFLQQVEAFDEANADIEVEAVEYEWDVTTFAAQLAGGTLPTVFTVPFTDPQGLIARQQVANITEQFESLPYAGEFNPSALAVTQDAEGEVYGIPVAGYGIGLHYNRTLFEQAGLDPDAPPTTWDQVREHANTIAQETGQTGYAQMTQNNTGGWMLTALTYALGGRMQSGSGEDVQSTIANPGTRQALELLHAMRWEDNSMGSNILFDWGSINQEFAAGQIGMYLGGSDVYTSLVTQNSINPDDYGLTVLPLSGDDAGVLAGGSVAVVNAKATDAEKDAAIRWIDHYYMAKLTDQDAAVADAAALAEGDQPVGTPSLPIFGEEQLAQSEAWVADYVNVPRDQMAGFLDNILDQELIPEPSAHSQEIYALLDTVVQTVLTDENADIDALLEAADSDATALIERG